jgi:HemY protein
LRAVRALHDPVWTADGYVSDRWRPVSPVSGRLDAFQWQMPLASLPSDHNAAIESTAFNEEMLASRRVEPPRELAADIAPLAAQDNSPANSPAVAVAVAEPNPAAAPAPSPPPTGSAPVTSAPLFRARTDLGKTSAAAIPPVIPILRAPDDPGIDDEPVSDEFAEQASPAQCQAGGWRGFLARWGS